MAVGSASIAAVVADKPLVDAVIRQRNAAIRALIYISAVAAAYELVCSAPIDKQYALLAALYILFKLGFKP